VEALGVHGKQLATINIQFPRIFTVTMLMIQQGMTHYFLGVSTIATETSVSFSQF
jgi:hypothetical protein